MNIIRQEKIISFADNYEYQSVKRKLENDLDFASVRKIIQACNDSEKSITYLTEEITPEHKGADRTKVLLLFKNPHPDSVAAGLFFSEKHSKSFWKRFFEVVHNYKLMPLLKKESWTNEVAVTLLNGKYDSPFLYFFRCLYPFPTNQFADLQKLFSGAPLTYKKEMLDRSVIDLIAYVQRHGIKHIIVFFYEGMELLGGKRIIKATNFTKEIKRWIDQYLCHNDPTLFWKNYISKEVLKQSISNGVNIYFNMNTHDKNHGDHLPKRYFTYNLEFILKDILSSNL